MGLCYALEDMIWGQCKLIQSYCILTDQLYTIMKHFYLDGGV